MGDSQGRHPLDYINLVGSGLGLSVLANWILSNPEDLRQWAKLIFFSLILFALSLALHIYSYLLNLSWGKYKDDPSWLSRKCKTQLQFLNFLIKGDPAFHGRSFIDYLSLRLTMLGWLTLISILLTILWAK